MSIKTLVKVIAVAMVSMSGASSFALINSPEMGLDLEDLPHTSKKYVKTTEDDESIFDDVRLHGGVALLNSFQDFQIAPGVRERGGIRGFELNFGIDLFSNHWIAQGAVVSLPESSVEDTRLSENGFELRILYESAILEGVTVHGGVGLASRSYVVKTKYRPSSTVRDLDRSFSSGASVMTAGIDYWPSGQLSAGVELLNHLPMANGDEPSSIDLGIRLNGHF